MTPAADLPAQGREKLEQRVVDFERIDEAGFKEGQWDVVFVACVIPCSNFPPKCLSSSFDFVWL